jgi:uncharacterized membrane protein (DUF4010 family)
MSETDVLIRFGVALAVGFGIGVERGYRQRDVKEGLRAMGVRTFSFLALIGAASGFSTVFAGPWMLAAATLGVIAFLIAGYRAGLTASPDLGLTTEMAAIATFLAGVLSGAGFLLAAALCGVAAIVLLHNKQRLHRLTGHLQQDEIDAGVKVLAIAALLIPLSPDQGIGPGQVLNPRELAIAVVIIAALGLAGHAAIRALGGKAGLAAFGLAGGLVSSTGVAISASRLAQGAGGPATAFAASTGFAQAAMFARTAALTAALNGAAFQALVWPLCAGATTAAVVAWFQMRRGGTPLGSMALGSIDTVNAAARFVAIAAVAMLAAAWIFESVGAWGFFVSNFIAGLVDVDAATATATRVPASPSTASFGILLALAANSLSKTIVAWRLGGRAMGLSAGYGFLGSGLAAALAFVGTLLGGSVVGDIS